VRAGVRARLCGWEGGAASVLGAISVLAVGGSAEFSDGFEVVSARYWRRAYHHTSATCSSFISTSGWSRVVPLSGRDASGWRIDGSCIMS
jgi:hypothetical protein